MNSRSLPRFADVPRRLAWFAWLGLVLPSRALGQEPGDGAGAGRREAAAADGAAVRLTPDAEQDGRRVPAAPETVPPASTAQGSLPAGLLHFADDVPAKAAENARSAPPRGKGTEATKSGNLFSKRSPRRTARGPSDPRLTGLAVTHGNVAAVANLRGVVPIEPAGRLATTAEHRIGLQDPAQPRVPADRPSVQAATIALDESVVKEITQRKTLFRMCYVSAQRRGVVATRADVKWILQPDGGVRDVVVEVAQDAQLANCIREVAFRPFPSGVGQEIPVAIPLLFVTSR